MKILIVEDNLILQKSVCILMDCWGFDFDVANNGQEAVERVALNEGKYDLCLMDIDMPIMNGYEAALALRRDFSYFPIMALSGKASIEETYVKAGMDDYLEKPCNPDSLLDKINELTIKSLKIGFKSNGIYFTKEMPRDAEELSELRELAKKDLALLIVEGNKQRFVVHENIQNKMSCILATKLPLTPEQFEAQLKEEDSDIGNYFSIVE